MSILKKIITLSLLGVIAVSCQILQSNKLPNKSEDNGQLGAIGKFSKTGPFSREFEEVGAIKLIKPIKMEVSAVSPVSHKRKKIDSIDSNIKDETVHLKLKIIDEINFIANLNSIENVNYLDFFKENNDTFIRSEGIWVFNTEQADILLNARLVYLINDGLSNYALKAFMPNEKILKIYFETSFIYDVSYLQGCWKENNRGEFHIAALKNKGQKCPGDTEENLKDLKKEDLFDKIE